MFGYMSAKEAKAQGFTHHGKYFGIPVWLGNPEQEGMAVAAKWAPMEHVLTLFHYIEGFMRAVLFPDDRPVFQFLQGPRITEGETK